uniref:Uncharacterized protein n=1 Tax=Anguilla anguilla TaxID=7936 RepID=A0A0E9UB08_ANGAN
MIPLHMDFHYLKLESIHNLSSLRLLETCLTNVPCKK